MSTNVDIVVKDSERLSCCKRDVRDSVILNYPKTPVTRVELVKNLKSCPLVITKQHMVLFNTGAIMRAEERNQMIADNRRQMQNTGNRRGRASRRGRNFNDRGRRRSRSFQNRSRSRSNSQSFSQGTKSPQQKAMGFLIRRLFPRKAVRKKGEESVGLEVETNGG